MLRANVKETSKRIPVGPSCDLQATSETASLLESQSRLAKALTIDWLGQTLASFCWIASMFMYWISSAGDWLQLLAASAWLVANVASITKPTQLG